MMPQKFISLRPFASAFASFAVKGLIVEAEMEPQR
jgi:hypothetical protein